MISSLMGQMCNVRNFAKQETGQSLMSGKLPKLFF